jgi:iron complex outermembrane recepter protein
LTPGITRTFFNASQQNTSGVDVDLRNTLSLGDMGKLEIVNGYTYMISLKRQLNPGQPLVERVDTYEFPRWRHTFSANWTRGAWGTTLVANTVAGFADFRTVAGAEVKVGNHMTIDAQVRYTGFKNLTLSLGGQNVANKKPPFSNENWYGYTSSVHNPRGAYWYGSLRYKF